ncbi:heterogeneous nuclear ribonucleo Q isoform X1 [Olea europaea subsp. europaea]|uniref:Heterogeneous nuclear ribonucleo Q isoform X1 n=1 Tax=Olea europaea subsp. europaea TaxID=158383 RepID=A0A8S0Q2T2_OLEEU|nr:heterogeneous nuclear ribonucleo Q isoform X1 [Olea europaea subsp. europaea]
MTDNTEIEDRVDFDDDNYIEEEDDVEEPMEDEGAGEGDEDDGDELQEDISGDSTKEKTPGMDGNNIGNEHVEDEEKPSTPIKEDDKEKHVELLSFPRHGSAIFIGGISREILEKDLRELCEPFGEIFEIRVMKNRDTGESRGFAFLAFRTKDIAQKAIEELHSKEFKGRTIRCSLSDTKYRLFIGNVPKSWTDDGFRKVIEATGPGAETIELIKKMSSGNFKLEGNTPTVTWADPKIMPDNSSASAQVIP